MIYQPIRSSRDFQNRILLGTTKESVHLDFKAQLNMKEPVKIAIDIAAFANTFGGTLLIGVSEKMENGVTTATHRSMARKTGNCSNLCGGE